jgi:Ca-activated chloride channel family protein
VCLALKCATFAMLVGALAGPWVIMGVSRLAVTILMDTSASMPRESVERGQEMLRDLVRKRSGADLRLITFAGRAHIQSVPSQPDKVTIPQEVDPTHAMATDMEGALHLALSTFPTKGVRRILLISDGNENQGHALSEALRARQRGVAVFTVPSGGTVPLPVNVASVESPPELFTGEHFTLSLHLDSSRPLPVRVWLTSQGQEIGSATLNLQTGDNIADLYAQGVGSDVMLMEAHISSANSEQVLFSQAISIHRPHVLYIAGDGKASAPLLQTLERAQVDVEMAAEFPTRATRNGWDAVLLDNYPDHNLSADEESALEKYVSAGGGLIFIAGDQNAHLSRDSVTPFERTLPVRALPPPEKPVAVVLVLDKSGSMQGRPIRMVRQATRASLLTLRPIDRVGVISFNQDFEWVIPMGPASEIESKADRIDEIVADGNTNIYQPTLAAFAAVLHEDVSSRHIILLTDGDQTEGTFQNFPQLERDAAAQHVAISTIGVGAEVNHALLDDLAHQTNGKSQFVEDSGLIPQIVSNEVRSADDNAIQERPVRAVPFRPAEFTDGIDFSRAPRLLGFVQAEAKKGAETILRVDRDKPLVVRWNYGLGSVIAVMTDAQARWAAPWVRWESFGTLWPQIVRDVSRHNQMIRAGVRPGVRAGETIVYYDLVGATGDQIETGLSLPVPARLVAQTPGGPSHASYLEKTAPGHYEARIPTAQRGLYRITSGGSDLVLPEVGFYRDSEELKPQAVNEAFLGEISRVTGGRVHPSINQLLDDRGSLVSEHKPLWPFLLLLALGINLLEVAFRKGLFERSASWLRRASPVMPK